MADPKIESLDLDQLQAIMKDPQKLDEVLAEPAEPSDTPPKPEPAEPVQPPGAEEKEPKKPETEPEPTEEEIDAEADLLLAELEEMRSSQAELSKSNDRLRGEASYLRQKFRELEQARTGTRPAETEPQETTELDGEPEKRIARPVPKRDSVAAWAVGQAISDAGRDFMASHSDLPSLIDPNAEKLETQQLQAKVRDTLKRVFEEIGFDAEDVITADDPIHAAQRTREALDEAYYRIRREAAVRSREAAQARKAEQVGLRQRAKADATTSGSGATPAPRPQPKPASELTVDEADAELRRYAKEQGYR